MFIYELAVDKTRLENKNFLFAPPVLFTPSSPLCSDICMFFVVLHFYCREMWIMLYEKDAFSYGCL